MPANTVRRSEIRSATVDVGYCEHADSNQRQAMADLLYGGCRHAADFSRALETAPFERLGWHVASFLFLGE
ncbi:hypothetical protein FGL95_06105 [Nocardiaceae bacterium YC2-7]|uniref:Uncharacterized protein n=1 Tax=Antrihabitans stalactiti TaxID=2584121 RepID=A0A848KEN4_9NOCA|nr:hypothetical protein [Antrihabitans stalactiti]